MLQLALATQTRKTPSGVDRVGALTFSATELRGSRARPPRSDADGDIQFPDGGGRVGGSAAYSEIRFSGGALLLGGTLTLKDK